MSTKYSLLLSAIILLTTQIFTACTNTPSKTQSVSPLTAPNSVLPTPTSQTTPDILSRNPADGTGALVGVLLLWSDGELQPVADVKLALGEILRDDNGEERMVGYDASTAPTTITGPDGRFIFQDVPPGRYGLILDIVMSSFLLFDESSGEAMLIDIPADEVVDLGNLEYTSLPIPRP